MSANLFRAWYCISIAYDELQEHSYLADDPSVRCDGYPEHTKILTIAWPLVAMWPIGMVVMYAMLLYPCHLMMHDETASSPLLRSTAFLHRDYKPSVHYNSNCGISRSQPADRIRNPFLAAHSTGGRSQRSARGMY